MDHAAGIAYYLSQRNFCGIAAGTIVAPQNLLGPIRDIIEAWARLDGNPIPANLVGVQPGDEHRIKPNLVARVFPTKHSRGSIGFTVIEKRKKLKTEYIGLTSKQIVELKKQGLAIDYPVEIPIVTYLGDTQYVDFSQLSYIAESKILIAECTFYEGDHSGRAEAGRHMHVDEFVTLLNKLNNEHIIVTHTTQRTPMHEIRRILKDALPKDKYDRITLLMDKRPKPR
jgi:ribonuclease Z